MGASGWDYAVDVDEDVDGALERLRQSVFANGDYLGPGGVGAWGAPARGRRPSSIEDLLVLQAEEGTHSILDICDGVTGEPAIGTASPLTAQELHDFFDTQSPSCNQVQAWMQDGTYAGVRSRWMAVYIVCQQEGVPRHVHFGGFSGD